MRSTTKTAEKPTKSDAKKLLKQAKKASATPGTRRPGGRTILLGSGLALLVTLIVRTLRDGDELRTDPFPSAATTDPAIVDELDLPGPAPVTPVAGDPFPDGRFQAHSDLDPEDGRA